MSGPVNGLRVITPVWSGRPATDLSWQEHGVCPSIGSDAFFPEYGDHGVAAARRICAPCPVKMACREYAVGTEERYGVWGGLGARSRRNIRAARTRAHHAAERAIADLNHARRGGRAA